MIYSIYDANFQGQKVFVRVDFNVPIDENHNVTDDIRIVESLPTIDKIIDDGGIPILASHLGRPKGKKNPDFSLRPVADYMIDKLGYDVIFAPDCIGEEAEKAVKKAETGQVVLLENVRFYKEEEENNEEFAEKMALLADSYVNDAFGSAHRAHASTHAIAKFFKEKYAGKLMLDELDYLGKAVANPKRPFVAVIGGAKISGKIDVIRSLMNKCDVILIGGGMMFTFYKAKGLGIGNSIVEEDKISLAKELIDQANTDKLRLLLPADVIVADSFSNDAPSQCVRFDSIPDGKVGMDIGIETQRSFAQEIIKAGTVVWNGPMGVFEMENFAKGTYSIASALAEATNKGAVTIVGGGDSAAAISKMNFKRKVSHVSTGGGASLEFLEGKELPGVAVLEV